MNSEKIESFAVDAVKRTVNLHPLLSSHINVNDKEPSWDGNIYIYNNQEMKTDHFVGRIPVQVKGKNEEKSLMKKKITYPVEYRHLRNYSTDGGVLYLVVVISDDGEKTNIFYNALTPVILKSKLKGKEDKEGTQTLSITLKPLKQPTSDSLYKILTSFHLDRTRQGTGDSEIMNNIIKFNDFHKIKRIQIIPYDSENIYEALNTAINREITMYGFDTEKNMFLPIDESVFDNIKFVTNTVINEPVMINGIKYYDSIEYEVDAVSCSIIFSPNLSINLSKNRLNYRPRSYLKELINDLQFLQETSSGKTIYIGSTELYEMKNQDILDISNNLKIFKQMKFIFETYHIPEKRICDFTETNWEEINRILNLSKDDFSDRAGLFFVTWDKKKIPLVYFKHKQFFEIFNAFYANENQTIFINIAGKDIPIPFHYSLSYEDLINLYDVDEKILLQGLCNAVFCKENSHYYNQIFLSFLSAYDTVHNEKFYNVAQYIVNELRAIESDEYVYILNQLQLAKRKRVLTNDELDKLDEINKTSTKTSDKCAANILLDNKHTAKKLLEKMSQEEKDDFVKYPIYNLLYQY